MEYSNLFVCLMGIGTVFFGLICIIVLTYIMSALCKPKKAAAAPAAPAAAVAAPAAPAAVPAPSATSPAMVAAVSAALAENLGTDISRIRIVSMKRL